MPVTVRRRESIAAIGGAALWPLAARAQKAGKVYRLGILTVAPERNWDGLFQALRDLGYVDGQNLIIERRYSEGQAERWSDLANELVGLKVDVIVVSTTDNGVGSRFRAARHVSRPFVDPVKTPDMGAKFWPRPT
jgi:putative tryptophan/tyrosine transport system substrate-binding protein